MAVAIIAITFRFWQLSRFNAFVFDEVYFVNFAQDYRQGIAPIDAHPPLGKYIIAASIQLGEWWTSHADRLNAKEVIENSPFSYRQANALVGSLIPLAVVGIARTLVPPNSSAAQRRKHWQFPFLCGIFVATDGLFVTESRYALLNVHLVCLGLLSHWLWLKAANISKAQSQPKREQTSLWLRIASGCLLGGAIATKWNGLGYLLSLIVWEIARLRYSASDRQFGHCQNPTSKATLRNLALLAIATTFTYGLIWWPHLHITQENIFSVHAYLFQFHQQLSADGHAACSKWYSWPLLVRPITYWYSTTNTHAYTVSNLGNPALWLLSSSTILLLAISRILTSKRAIYFKPQLATATSLQTTNLKSYLVISYFCNWLPWILVQRCTFNYLYMPAAVFSFMALAWLLSTWLTSYSQINKAIAWLLLSVIAIAFIFWSPLTFGWPLSFEQLQKRWLLKSWI